MDERCDECAQPVCLTEECTDQCLVLACDDCQVTNDATTCDGACITADACNDCSGLDEILQCCTDYHSYCTEQKPYDALIAPWGTLPCDCTQESQPILPPSIQSLFSDSSISSSASSSPNLSPFSPQLHVSSPFPFQSTPVQSFPCMWSNCDALFSSLSDLVGHVNLQHLCNIDTQTPTLPLPSQDDPLLPLSCHWGDCAMFSSPSSVPSSSLASSDHHILNTLTAHLMQDHLGLNYPFSLPTLHPPPDLPDISGTVHQPPVSPNSPPLHDCSGHHVCMWKSCTQSFSSCNDLTAHIASVHIGGGKAHYECFWEGCNRHGTNGFSSKQKISRHLQSHTGHRPFQCEVCNQNFSEAATLQQHMRRHTREKPYVCDSPGCGKAFATTGALTIHKRTHNGSRPFKCKFCDKAFSESSNLSKHLRTHTGARPYECTEEGCNKAFARPDQLARHKNVHRKKSKE